ncbi:MAG: SDR family NAD(P)-dependent oxidoreductase [Actinomycetota bacterium]
MRQTIPHSEEVVRLEKKVAIVTGGGTGIGAAIVRRFAAEGASVVVTGRRPGPIHEVARETGAVAIAGDAADAAHVADAVGAALDRFGGLDVVVANAGVGFGGRAGDVTDESWRRTIEVNLNAPMQLVRASLPALIDRGAGSIVLVSSISAFVSGTDSAAYNASKAALGGLARSIAVDYGKFGIRANALCPGWVRTPMADGQMDKLGMAGEISREEAYRAATANVPLRRAADPDEIATCCLFLASDEASFVTGAALIADGGSMAVDAGGLAFDLPEERG